jgi:hypothetical protein
MPITGHWLKNNDAKTDMGCFSQSRRLRLSYKNGEVFFFAILKIATYVCILIFLEP